MDISTRRKISRTMKGKSNFEGKKHTHATKIQIGFSQEGHRNAKDHKWVTDKETGEEHRVKGNKPKGTRWGRTSRFSQWVHNEGFVAEAKATYCGRCGTTHVAPKFGGTCPALKEDALDLVEKSVPKHPENEAFSDNSANRLQGTDSLAQIYKKDTPGQSNMKKIKQISELKKATLSSYVKAAHQDMVDRASSSSFKSGSAGDTYNKADETPKEKKRTAGIGRALSKIVRESSGQKTFKVHGTYNDKDGNVATVAHKIKFARDEKHAKQLAASSVSHKFSGYKPTTARELTEAGKWHSQYPKNDQLQGDELRKREFFNQGEQDVLKKQLKRKLGIKALRKEEEEIVELKKTTLNSYVKKAVSDFGTYSRLGKEFDVDATTRKTKVGREISADNAAYSKQRASQRQRGISKAVDRLSEMQESQIDELNKSTLASYTDKVVDPVHGIPKSTTKLSQRLQGLQRVHKRMVGTRSTKIAESTDNDYKLVRHYAHSFDSDDHRVIVHHEMDRGSKGEFGGGSDGQHIDVGGGKKEYLKYKTAKEAHAKAAELNKKHNIPNPTHTVKHEPDSFSGIYNMAHRTYSEPK